MSKPKYYDGKTIKEWSEVCGIPAQMIKSRLKEGWTINDAISVKPYGYRNKDITKKQLAENYNVNLDTLNARIKRGMTIEDALRYEKPSLVGQQYHRLFVKQEVEPKIDPNGRHRRQYLCACDCGNETIVLSELLTSGRTRSCGCLRKETNATRREKNLISKTFGRWRVESEAFRDRTGIHWNVVCSCGNKGIVTTSNLLNGTCMSCGCYNKDLIAARNKKDIAGQKFSALLAIEPVGKNQNNSWLWRCKCDCGREIITTTGRLLGGQIMSCGCIKSINAKIIEDFLQERNILFSKEKYFKDLKYVNYLYFDFCITDHDGNLHLIEYQGKQHYVDCGEFGKQQREITDQIKKDYCQSHNIPLYEIRYDEDVYNKLNEIIAHVNPVLNSETSE